MFRVGIVVTSCCIAAYANPGGARRFDFQPKGGALMNGFTEVSPKAEYTRATGYGFVGSGRNAWASGTAYPDPLRGDWIRVGREFQVDVKNGAYEVRVWLHGPAPQLPSGTTSLWVNGKLVHQTRVTHDSFYRRYYVHEFTDYRQGEDVYEKYIRPLCQAVVVHVRAANGKLKLKVNDRLVYGITLVPEEAAARQAQKTEEACRAYFRAHYLKRRTHMEPAPKPMPSRQDRERGYILFAKHYLEEVYPNTNPRPWDMRNEIAAFASWGEFEPFAFSIYPLRNLNGIRLDCTDFTGPGGARIPRENIDVRVVRYKERKPYPSKTGLAYYTVAPEILVKVPTINVEKGVNRTFWVTVHVPNNATPGPYEAQATIAGDSVRPETMKLILRVLPIRLGHLKNRYHWTGAYPPVVYLHFKEQKKDRREYYAHLEAELRDIRDHGFTEYGYYATWLPAPDMKVRDGRVVGVDFAETRRVIEIYKRVGMPVPPITMKFCDFVKRLFPGKVRSGRVGHGVMYAYDGIPDFETKTAAALRELVATAREAGMPPVEMSLPDEPNRDRLAPVLKRAKLIASVPSVTSATSGMIPATAEVLGPFVRVWGTYLRDARQLLPLAEKHRAILTRDHGSARRNPNRMRFENGFWFYKTGFHAIRWWYNVERNDTDPYCTFNAASNWESNLVYSTFAGPPNPTLDWEAAREGVDDCRYVCTLVERVRRAKDDGRPAVRHAVSRAKAALAEVLDPIEIDERYYQSLGGEYSPDAYDKYRWKIAEAILAIDDAVRGKASRKATAAETVPWWNPAFEARARIEVDAGPWQRENTIVSTVLPAGLSNVRLVEVGTGGPKLVPFVWRRKERTIFWRLADHTPSLTARVFYAYGSSKPAATPSDPLLERAVRKYEQNRNLVVNGGFEAAKPVGWRLYPKPGSPATIVVGPAHSGRKSLRFNVGGKRNGAVCDDVILKPNTEYLFTCWTRLIRGSAGLIMWASIRCYSRDGAYLERFQTTRRDRKPGWQLSALRFTTPPETHHATVGISPARLKGTILFDDVQMHEYSRDRFLPPKVTVGKVEMR